MPARAFYILVHFFAVRCKTTTSNDQIIGFVENMNTQHLLFLLLFELESRPSSHVRQTKDIGTTVVA